MRSIAKFIGASIDEANWKKLVEHCTFDYIKSSAAKSAPLGDVLWEGGAETFINKGINGRWRDLLTADDNREYEKPALSELGAESARWLATGER